MNKSSNINSRYDEDVIEKWNLIKNESPKVNGVVHVDTNNLPDWIDRERYVNVCLPLFAKIRPSLTISALVGLSYLVQIPTILHPLLYTKKSESICALFNRYFDTLLYVRDWHTTDIFDPKSAGYKSLIKVRSMHTHINKVMNAVAEEHSKPPKVAPNVWVSQYDMVVTQWAFYGLQMMYPKECALYHVSDDELYEIIYCWRVISYFIGIDDRFSLFGENLDKSKQLCFLMFDEVYRPVLEEDDTTSIGAKMANDIFKSMAPILGPFTAPVANKYWYEILGIKRDVVLETWSESFFYNFVKVAYGGILKWNVIYSSLNWIIEWNILKQMKAEKREENVKIMEEKTENTEIRYIFDSNVL